MFFNGILNIFFKNFFYLYFKNLLANLFNFYYIDTIYNTITLIIFYCFYLYFLFIIRFLYKLNN